MSSEAFVTSATNDDYALGASVLAQSIRQQFQRKRKLVVLISKQLSNSIKFDLTFPVHWKILFHLEKVLKVF